MSTSGPSFALGFVLTTSLFAGGCDSCRRNRPFTPFAVGSASSSTAASAVPTAVAQPSATNANDTYPVEGERLPANVRQVRVGARQADAPSSMVFDSVLRGDWNGDGAPDGVALLRTTAPDSQSAGAIFFYPGSGDAKKISDLPGWIPSREDCTWQSQLKRVGRATVSIDLRLNCTAPMPSRTPTRYLAMLAPTRSDPLLATWRIADSAPDEGLSVALNGEDRDGDTKDDVTLSVALTHVPTKREVRAEFAWMDRAAGVSREPAHFADSLAATLGALDKQASNRKSAAEAQEGAATVWRLLASACGQSATARIFRSDGSTMNCENIANLIARLVGIEVRAALSQNDVLRAAYAITRADSALGVRPTAADRANWMKSIRKSVTLIDAIDVVPSEVKPAAPRTSVHFSPLRFQPDGVLLVQTHHGVVRVLPDGRESSDEDAGTAAASWPLIISGNDDRALDSILPACDRSELLVAYKGSDGRLLPPEPTIFLAPRPGVCAGAPTLGWRVSPIGLTEDRIPITIVEGACIAPKGPETCLKATALGTVIAGSPRSPDGHRLLAMTGIGLVAIGDAKPELWAGDKLGNPAALSDCVIDNSGDHIACVKASKLVLLSKGSAPDASTTR